MSSLRRIMFLLSALALVAANPDVIALLALKDGFRNASTSLLGWEPSSSPCAWRGVKCRNNKVTSLELSGHNLSGTLSADIGKLSSLLRLNLSRNRLMGRIPLEIGSLKDLEVLDLHKNYFNGQIPESVTELKKLKILDLSFNNFSGRVPSGIATESIKGNPHLCTSDSCAGAQAHSFSIAMVAVMAAVLGILSALAVAGTIRWWRQPKLQAFSGLGSEKFSRDCGYECPTDYTMEELKLATAEFDETNIVGQGVNGVVYKGKSSAGTDFAVKKFFNVDFKVDFQRELEHLSAARHRNIASLLGFCYVRNQKFLVSEYVPYPSLVSFFSGQRRKEFDWDKRKAVILGVAKALAYLHSSDLEIVHGSLKPSNILVEDDFTPKLTDHGLCSLLQEISRARDPKTAIYEPPEASNGKLTFKSDTYSFGVLLVQMITGQPPWLLLETVRAAGTKLREWVLVASHTDDFVDEELRKPPSWEMKKMTQLATLCMEVLPVLRPRMDEVVQFLVEEMLISNKSSELDGLFIELVMDNRDSFGAQGNDAARRTGESLLPGGSASHKTPFSE